MHQVSVIISNFNGAKYLQRLIATLKASEGVELELIVVDRNSKDESHHILAGHPDIKVLQHPPETGLVSGYHSGTALATHELFFFMNEDMWMDPHCLKRCCDLMESNARIASIMPVQWTYDGSAIVNAGIWLEECLWNRACPVLNRRSRWHLVARPARVSYANAGACLIRKSAYEAVGGWDTSFFLDDEDTDISIRFWQRDWECWVHPDATIGHAVGASNAKQLPSTGTTVGCRRYVCAFSNFLVMALKTFSVATFRLPLLAALDRIVRNLLKARFHLAVLDVRSLLLTARRLPDIISFRKANQKWNATRPGQGFFSEPAFQHTAIAENTSERVDVLREALECVG